MSQKNVDNGLDFVYYSLNDTSSKDLIFLLLTHCISSSPGVVNGITMAMR